MTLPSIQQMLSGDQFFDRFFEQLSTNRFPLYNVRVDDTKMYVEFALAGYKKENLDVEFSNNILMVSADKVDKAEEGRYYVKNISEKSFSTKFRIPANYELKEASFTDGMLVVEFNLKPEEKEVNKIEIK